MTMPFLMNSIQNHVQLFSIQVLLANVIPSEAKPGPLA